MVSSLLEFSEPQGEILIQSRDAKSLNRYFPELLETLNAQLPARCVLDGEIVVAKNNELDFEELQLRIHPAASRVKLLSRQSPASIVFFDLLCEGNRDWRSEPFEQRREKLESLLASTAARSARSTCRSCIQPACPIESEIPASTTLTLLFGYGLPLGRGGLATFTLRSCLSIRIRRNVRTIEAPTKPTPRT